MNQIQFKNISPSKWKIKMKMELFNVVVTMKKLPVNRGYISGDFLTYEAMTHLVVDIRNFELFVTRDC